MQAHATHDRGGTLAAVGGIILVIGAVGYALQLLSVDVAEWLGGSGWTVFIIVPGLVLLGAAAVVRGTSALGATIAGAIVTTVGLLLLYQDQAAHYESWAYAWALIPASVGIALAVHGLRFSRPDLITLGTRIVAGFGLAMLVGAWYFETVFQTDRLPFDLGDGWPILLIVLGGLLFLVGLVRGSAGGADEPL